MTLGVSKTNHIYFRVFAKSEDVPAHLKTDDDE